MNLIAISSLGWRNHEARACALISGILRDSRATLVTLDADALRRAGQQLPDPLAARQVKLAAWLKQGTDNYVVDYQAVQVGATELGFGEVLIMDGTGFPAAVVHDVLLAVRQAWFALESWPSGFVLICDDALLLGLADHLLDAFYVRPAVLTPFEAMRKAKQIQKRAVIARWFGARGTRLHKLLYRVWDSLEQLASTRVEKQMTLAEKWKHH